MRSVAITGSTGFIGRHIAGVFATAGWRVIGLSRGTAHERATRDQNNRHFDLYEPERANLAGADVLIHCAFEPYRGTTSGERSVNVDGSRLLFATARAQGVSKIVFLSSFAARASTTSRYGYEKRLIEEFLQNRDLAIRPGLVVGNGGIFRVMFDSIRKTKLAPIFFSGRQPMYPIAIDDLCRAVLTLVAGDHAGTYTLAAHEPVTMKSLYESIARSAGVNVVLLPLPYSPVLRIVELIERMGGSLPISSGSLRGIPSMQSTDVPSYEHLGITIRPFSEIMPDAAFA